MKEFLCCDYQRYVNFTFPIYLWPTVVFFRSQWISIHSNVLLPPQSTFWFLRPLVSFSSSSYLLTVTHRKKVRLRGRKYDWGEQSTTERRKVRLRGEKNDWEENPSYCLFSGLPRRKNLTRFSLFCCTLLFKIVLFTYIHTCIYFISNLQGS